jgi:hypothetical protein
MAKEPPHPLGPVRARYHFDPRNWRRTLLQFSLFGLVGLMFVPVGLFGLPEAVNPGPDAVPRHVVGGGLAILGGLIAAGCGGYLWWESRYRDSELVVRQRGVLLTQAGTTEVCRWEDIREVLWDLVPRIFIYKLRLNDGRSLVITSDQFRLEDVKAFGTILREVTAELDEPPEWTQISATL